jgi:asparagine synthase (glutamine-hydrolysing)
VVPDRLRDRLFSPGFRRELQGHWAGSLYVDTMRGAPAQDALGQAQYADIQHWLPGDILTKMDRASMAVSLEAREPLLDHELVAWAAGLPPELRVRRGQGKWLMKRAMERYVPRNLLYRPKMGFVVPISDWFRGPLADRAEALASRSAAVETGWFDRSFLTRVAADHRAGRADHGRLLWQLLMLDQSLGKLVELPPARVAA